MIKASYNLSDFSKDAWRDEGEYIPPLTPRVITVSDEELYKEKREENKMEQNNLDWAAGLTKHITDKVKAISLDILTQNSKQVLEDIKNEVKNIVDKESNRPLEITIKDQKPVKIKEATHEAMPLVLKSIGARLPVFMVGEAGSGKTHLVEQVAKVLNLNFYCVSVCAQTTCSSLLGYMDANGKYVRSLFREAYEKGGVFLLDEIDNGNPNVLSVLNSAIANHVCSFPDAMVAKHPDFVLCASGNTYGHGANRKYVGRLEIDAATLDRFVFIEIGYDKKLERKICGNKNYANLIQTIRERAEALQCRSIISPRASINGVKLLNAGVDLNTVLDTTVFKDMPEDIKRQILNFEKVQKHKEEVEKELSGGKSGDNNGSGNGELFDGNEGQNDSGESGADGDNQQNENDSETPDKKVEALSDVVITSELVTK